MQQPKLVAIIAIVFLWIAVQDWQQRVRVEADEAEESDRLQVKVTELWQPVTEQREQQVLSYFSDYLQPEQAEKPPAKEWDTEYQQQQQGELNSLYAGTLRLRLVGVIRHEQEFILLAAYDQNQDQTELRKLQIDDSISGYRLAGFTSRLATFNADDGRVLQLKLFDIAGNNE